MLSRKGRRHNKLMFHRQIPLDAPMFSVLRAKFIQHTIAVLPQVEPSRILRSVEGSNAFRFQIR